MEEARCTACAAGAYMHSPGVPLAVEADPAHGVVAAPAAPTEMEVDYRGQARAGDPLIVLTWWDSEARCHCFEVVRDDGDSDAVDDGDGSGELLATGRIWCAQGGSNGQSADAGAGAAKI